MWMLPKTKGLNFRACWVACKAADRCCSKHHRFVVWRTQVELKQTAEKLHVQDISTTMNQTEAFKLMMREKEALIAEKYQLTDKVNTLRKQSKASEEKWQREKETLETSVSEKSSALEEMKAGCERLQSEIAHLKVSIKTEKNSFCLLWLKLIIIHNV